MPRWEPDAEGRLIAAALDLFERRGYDDTTVAEIAEAAGLTKRSFFRHFADKREVLFRGSSELTECWIGGIRAAAPAAGPLEAVAGGLRQVAALFSGRHAFARTRAGVIAANPELQERELIKLQRLVAAIADALIERGVAPRPAVLAAQSGVTVFHLAFAEWVGQDDPDAFWRLMDESMAELRLVVSDGVTAGACVRPAGRWAR